MKPILIELKKIPGVIDFCPVNGNKLIVIARKELEQELLVLLSGKFHTTSTITDNGNSILLARIK